MGVTVASIFRDSTDYLDRYFLQIAKLEAALGEEVSLALCEGDSTDGTYDALERHLVDHANADMLVKVEHGGPKFGSVDHPQRWSQIALCCNALMEQIRPTGPVIYVESDLMWTPDVMERLLEDLAVYPAVAPMSMTAASGGEMRFYDIWGHRGLDGERFHTSPPYHEDLATGAPLVKIGSAGSCVAMQEKVAKVVRFGDNDCIVGLGRDINHHASLWLDTRVSVIHP